MTYHPHTARVAAAPAPAPTAADFPTDLIVKEPYAPPAIDPHGFDTTEYDWMPVRRKPRPDGWSNEKQRAFIGHLADDGSVALAAQQVGMSVTSCYRLRRKPGAENFARAWDAAIREAGKRLLDVAFERATIGAEEPVFNADGQVIAIRNRPSDRMLIFLLRTKLGDRLGYGLGQVGDHDAQGGKRPALDAASVLHALPSVAQAMIALEPAQPEVPPHLGMTPEDLAHAVQIADLADGELPHWLRDAPVAPPPRRALNGLTQPALSDTIASTAPPVSPLGDEFERLLAEAKRGIADLADWRMKHAEDDEEDAGYDLDVGDFEDEDADEDGDEDGDEDADEGPSSA